MNVEEFDAEQDSKLSFHMICSSVCVSIPVSFLSAMMTDTGSISVKQVIEFGTFTTLSYFTIFVMKFL